MGGSKALLFGMALTSVLLAGVSLAAPSSSADFVVTTTAPGNQFISGNLTFTNDKSGSGALANVSNFIPGDTATRVITITNTGNIGFTYTAAASATASTLLWTDTTSGLKAVVYRCPSATACTTATTPAGTAIYGSLATPLTLSGLSTAASGTIAAAGIDYLTVVISLPNSAGNTFRALTQDFTITFTATQLAGTAR